MPIPRVHPARRFARLNGWGQSSRRFTMCQLAGLHGDEMFPMWHRGNHPCGYVMDHLYYFTASRRPIALVTMPYHAKLEAVRELASLYGLDVQAPLRPRSGWWFPGRTFCFAFVRPGTAVKWLPEQIGPRRA
jgi:hypothetical protein